MVTYMWVNYIKEEYELKLEKEEMILNFLFIAFSTLFDILFLPLQPIFIIAYKVITKSEIK